MKQEQERPRHKRMMSLKGNALECKGEEEKAKAKEKALIQNVFRALYRLDATWMEVICSGGNGKSIKVVGISNTCHEKQRQCQKLGNTKRRGGMERGRRALKRGKKRVNRNKPVQRLYHKWQRQQYEVLCYCVINK